MRATPPLPEALRGRPFTRGEALASGVGLDVLRGPRVRRLFRGVYVAAEEEPTTILCLQAAMVILPKDVVVSHLSALLLWGFDARRGGPLEFSTNTSLVTAVPGLRLHRRGGRLAPFERQQTPVTGPDRTFVDCATRLGLVELVQVAEHLVHTGMTTVETLTQYCHDRHLHGVQRARRAMGFVLEGAESPMETLVRLMLVFARLPCPAPNRDIHDGAGRFVARVDLLFVGWKVIVEYDGWQHERDARQRQRDHVRRERLEALGYRVIVVTVEDLRSPATVPWRVFHALRERGYAGPPPTTSVVWRRWFTRAPDLDF